MCISPFVSSFAGLVAAGRAYAFGAMRHTLARKPQGWRIAAQRRGKIAASDQERMPGWPADRITPFASAGSSKAGAGRVRESPTQDSRQFVRHFELDEMSAGQGVHRPTRIVV